MNFLPIQANFSISNWSYGFFRINLCKIGASGANFQAFRFKFCKFYYRFDRIHAKSLQKSSNPTLKSLFPGFRAIYILWTINLSAVASLQFPPPKNCHKKSSPNRNPQKSSSIKTNDFHTNSNQKIQNTKKRTENRKYDPQLVS